jgi:hypothetical protein
MLKRIISLKAQGFPGEESMIQSSISSVPSARNHFLFSSLGMNPKAIFVAALQRAIPFVLKVTPTISATKCRAFPAQKRPGTFGPSAQPIAIWPNCMGI